MRLQLIALILAAAAGSAGAQPSGDQPRSAAAAVQIYADDDHVTVVSPSASAHAVLSDQVELDADTAIDAVTAASVDVLSQASPYSFSELRVEAGLAVRWTRAAGQLRARLGGSTERDYDALRLGLGARRELGAGNLTLDLAYAGSIDRVGRAGDPRFARGRDVHVLELTATQLLDRRSVADLVVSGSADRGYLANPYRFVPILDPAGVRTYSLAEAVPELRLSAIALVRLRRAVARDWFVHASYRFAGDSWRVTSHTAELRTLWARDDDRLAASLAGRAYLQSAASFWSRTWMDDGRGAPAWRTLDRTLGGLWSLAVELTADRAIGGDFADEAIHVFASLSLVRFTWRDFALQAGRTGVIAALGASAPF